MDIEAFGQFHAEVDLMRVVKRVSTSAPPEIVWQVLADVERWPEWTPTVNEVSPCDNRGLTFGARYRVVQPGLRPAIYEVTQCKVNESFIWEQKILGGRMIADHRLTATGGGTEIELSFSSQGVLAGLAGNLLAGKIDTFVETEANSLKNHCDNFIANAD